MSSLRPSRDLFKPIRVASPSTYQCRLKRLCAWRRPRLDGRKSRIACALLLLVVFASLDVEQLSVGAQTVIPATDPNSVVPPAFKADMSWSEEGGWHWVAIAYDGSQRFTGPTYDYSRGRPLAQATYVATRVKSLSASDPCTTCVRISETEQGPPIILGGSTNDALAGAYANLDNGPRRKIMTSDGRLRWTNGAWYLNYSPATKRFFSWTWIPDDGRAADDNALGAASTGTVDDLGQFSLSQSVAAGSRVFPLATSYVITQPYGCVPLDPGYVRLESCPPDRPSFHDGVDIAAPLGTPILAAASGTVTFAGIDGTESGNSKIVVRLDGANAGFENVYLHWETSYVQVGDRVSAGQVIASVGSVGYSTGPHLHFAVLSTATNQTIDPLGWLHGAIQINIAGAQAEGAYINVMRWRPLIDEAAQAHDVPAALIAAIMAVESGGNPNAVSPAGAQGLMQIMPSELTRLGVPQDRWLDPAANIDAGARYLAESLSAGASIEEAAARYFGSGCDALGTCTAEYVNRVVVLYVYFEAWFSSGAPPMLTVQPFTSAAAPSPVPAPANEAPPPAEAAAPPPPPAPPSTPEATPAPTTPEPTPAANPPATTPEQPAASATPPESAPASTEPASPASSSTAATSPTPSADATAATPTASPTETAEPSPTINSAETATPTPTDTASPEATPAQSANPSPEATPPPTPSPSPATPSTTETSASTATPTATPEPTAIASPTPGPDNSTPVSGPEGDNESGAEPTAACLIGSILSELTTPDGAQPAPDTTDSPFDICAPQTATP